jgi:hypothetical protein
MVKVTPRTPLLLYTRIFRWYMFPAFMQSA